MGKINKLSLSEEEKEKEHPRWKALVESECCVIQLGGRLTLILSQSTVCRLHPSRRRLQR